MKITRVTCCLFVLLLSLVALAFSTTAPRAHAAASGSTTVFRFNALTAIAAFDSTSGCIETFADVDGTQSNLGPEADVLIAQFDNCTGTLLLEAVGSTLNPNFQVAKSLTSASLSATISVFDFVSGNTFNVSVNMAWTSTSTIMNEVQTFHIHTKGFTENFHLNATFRDASASGTVSNGTTNFTPSPSVFAQIASVKVGDVTISHS
jgi:hypothetical protein